MEDRYIQKVKIKNANREVLGRELNSEQTFSKNMGSETHYFQTIIKIVPGNERRVRQRANFERPIRKSAVDIWGHLRGHSFLRVVALAPLPSRAKLEKIASSKKIVLAIFSG